jgi:hypothetical protein
MSLRPEHEVQGDCCTNFNVSSLLSFACPVFFSVVMAVSAVYPLSAQERLPHVIIDLGGAAVHERLPFDVSFLLAGKADPSLRVLGVAVLLGESSSLCQQTSRAVIDGETPDFGGHSVASYARWRRHAAIAADSFHLVIDPLKHSSDYTFCFSQRQGVAASLLEPLRGRWIAAIDSAAHTWSAEPSAEQIRLLQESVIARVAAIAGTNVTATIPEESLLRSSYRFARLLDEQDERDLAIADAKQTQQELRRHLESLARLPALTQLLTPRTRGSAEWREALERYHRGTGIARALTVGGFSALTLQAADGLIELADSPPVPAGPSTALDSVRRVEDVVLRVQNLRGTYRSIEQLLALVDVLSENARMRVVVGLRPEQVRELRGAVDQVRRTTITHLERLERIGSLIEGRRALIESDVADFTASAISDVWLTSTTWQTYRTRGKASIHADMGFAYLPAIGDVSSYVGAAFYLRPINKDARLWASRNATDWFLRSFSFTVGVSLNSLAREGVRENLFGSQNLLVGGGFRFTDAFRIAGGGVILREADANPAIRKSSLAVSPFVSASLDFELFETLGRLGTALFK